MELRSVRYEFVIPSKVLIADPTPWPILTFRRDALNYVLYKPVAGGRLVCPVDGTVGNEGVLIGHTAFTVGISVNAKEPNPEWYVPLQVVRDCIQWIRVVANHYWLDGQVDESKSVARGSVIEADGTYKNFAASRTPFPPRPLTKETWQWIGVQLATGSLPPIPKIMFCDALLNFREQEWLKTIIQLGVVCELALNAFLDDLLVREAALPRTLYRELRQGFRWRLNNMPALLGAEKYQDHNQKWSNLLCDLYDLRGKAIHKAVCEINGKPVEFSDMAKFVFAVDDFLSWLSEQRSRLGLA